MQKRNHKMSERPTPETDAARVTEKNGCIATFGVSQVVSVNFARKLERERDEARELLASEKITRNHIIQRGIEMQKERDEARDENTKLRDIAERAINYLDQSYQDGFADEVSDLRYEIQQLKEKTK